MTPHVPRFLLVAATAFALVAFVACSRQDEPPRVAAPESARTLAQGDVVGYVGQYGSHVFRGLPFAAPPVGELRWRAPQPPAGWSGVREALEQGSFCPQIASPLGGVAGEPGEVLGDEDCLFLDVYAPRTAADAVPTGDERLPVMFWIHGGGNVIGQAGFYDGGRLAQERGVVVVATNYRIGPLGWLRHAALREGAASPEDASGNYGTLDLVRALEWVRDNVSAFGGDPGNVTIFGESAGGTNVFSLLVSPKAAGLFHRAIAQSGGTYMRTPSEAENFADDAEPGATGSSNQTLLRLLELDGTATDAAAARAALDAMSSTDVAAYLRGKSAEDLLAAYATEAVEGLIDVPTLFREGTVIPVEHALERLGTPDGWNVVPVIAGTNRDENKLFLFANERHVRNWLGFIPRLKDEEGFMLRAKYQSLMWKATGSDEPATAMRAVSPDVWSYRFDWDEEPSVLGADLSEMLGAAHGFEIPFVFGHYDLGEAGKILFDDDNLAGREELAGRMMSYWTEFARAGDPGRGRDGTLPHWQRWSVEPDGPRFVVLDTDAGGGIRMSSETVTQQDVIAAASADAQLAERDDRCDVLEGVASWSDTEPPAECATGDLSRIAAGDTASGAGSSGAE